jgi:hypothetical protein
MRSARSVTDCPAARVSNIPLDRSSKYNGWSGAVAPRGLRPALKRTSNDVRIMDRGTPGGTRAGTFILSRFRAPRISLVGYPSDLFSRGSVHTSVNAASTSACATMFRSLLDIPGHVDDSNLLAALDIEQRLQHGRALVVKEVVIPVPLHQFWNQHGKLTIGILLLQL